MTGLSAAAFKSWQPTLAATVTALCGFIVMYPEHFAQWPIVIDFAKYAGLGGLIAFGISAKSATLGSNLPTAQLPPSLRDEHSQEAIGMNPPEEKPSIVQGAIHEEKTS